MSVALVPRPRALPPLPPNFVGVLAGLLLLLLLSPAIAQDSMARIEVNGAILDGVVPVYFDGGTIAYAATRPFAEALGAEVSFRDNLLVLTRGQKLIAVRLTTDPRAANVHAIGALVVDDRSTEAPLGVLLDGVSYLPIRAVGEALGASVRVNPDTRTISLVQPWSNLAGVRIGQQADRTTRIVLDLAGATPWQVEVAEGGLRVALLRTRWDPPETLRWEPIGNLRSLRLESTQHDVVVVLDTIADLEIREGSGYRISSLPGLAAPVTERLIVDLGPGLEDPNRIATRPSPLTPPPETAPRPEPEPARRRVVVLDASHGGKDPGAVNNRAPLYEKDVVLDLALRVRSILERAGIGVLMTREDDTFIELSDRAAMATAERNLFVSIHANASVNRNANGIETYILGRTADPTVLALAVRENGGGAAGEAVTNQVERELASLGDRVWAGALGQANLAISRRLAQSIHDQIVRATGSPDRGVRPAPFLVIRQARIPAVLLEVGYISNDAEARQLAQPAYRQRIAAAIAAGILAIVGGATE